MEQIIINNQVCPGCIYKFKDNSPNGSEGYFIIDRCIRFGSSEPNSSYYHSDNIVYRIFGSIYSLCEPDTSELNPYTHFYFRDLNIHIDFSNSITNMDFIELRSRKDCSLEFLSRLSFIDFQEYKNRLAMYDYYNSTMSIKDKLNKKQIINDIKENYQLPEGYVFAIKEGATELYKKYRYVIQLDIFYVSGKEKYLYIYIDKNNMAYMSSSHQARLIKAACENQLDPIEIISPEVYFYLNRYNIYNIMSLDESNNYVYHIDINDYPYKWITIDKSGDE